MNLNEVAGGKVPTIMKEKTHGFVLGTDNSQVVDQLTVCSVAAAARGEVSSVWSTGSWSASCVAAISSAAAFASCAAQIDLMSG